MAYLSSANVKVFPTSYRGSGIDPEARLNSERNLTLSLNSFADYNSGSFVLDYTNHVLKFIIGGYYFEATLDSSYDTGTWYAHIKTVDRGTAQTWLCKSLARLSGTESDVLDASNTFYGLAIDNYATKEGCINLKVLEGGAIAAESKLKISSDSVGNSYKVSTTTYNMPISQLLRSNAVVVNKGARSGDTGLTIGYDMQNPASSANFSVDGYTGNTSITGTLSVTGATTLTSATLSSTLSVTGASTFTGAATFNGGATTSSLNVSGDANVTGKIQCANLEAGQEVKCDGLAVGQIGGIGTDDITLCKTLLPQNSSTVNLGSGSHLFNNVCSKELYLINGVNSIDISCSNSTWSIAVDCACKFLTGGSLTIGRSGRATATFGAFDVTFDRKIIARRGIQVDGAISSDVLQSNVDIKIASGKHLDLSGSSTGSIKLKGEKYTGSESYTVVGNGIYNITFKSNLGSAPNSTYSVTMALIIPSPSSLLDSTIYSSEVYRIGQIGWSIKAVHNSTGWTLTFTSGDNQANCNWFVTKIADVA